jgi:hypothetical protein
VNAPDVTLTLSSEVVEEIARRAAAIALATLDNARSSPWLDTRGAATHLGWPVERIYKHVGEVPHYRHGARLAFRADELDAFMERHRERRVA